MMVGIPQSGSVSGGLYLTFRSVKHFSLAVKTTSGPFS